MLFRHADYTVHQAALVPVGTVKAAGTRRKHINGWTVQMTPALLASPGATDITERLRSARTDGVAGLAIASPLLKIALQKAPALDAINVASAATEGNQV